MPLLTDCTKKFLPCAQEALEVDRRGSEWLTVACPGNAVGGTGWRSLPICSSHWGYLETSETIGKAERINACKPMNAAWHVRYRRQQAALTSVSLFAMAE